ncbi:MAG TPA: HlyD family efflux transporter periplasmic adaptor subunit [Blastocatellia bacterium]|nr:HlyD family efflux transporter periplasmic adaptor subunit [Blastocatellia bacterium]
MLEPRSETEPEIDAGAEMEQAGLRWCRYLIYAISALFVSALAWAGLSTIDVVVEISGKTSPLIELRPVTSATEGRIDRLFIGEGARVDEQHPVARIETESLRTRILGLEHERIVLEEQLRQRRLGGGREAEILDALFRISSLETQIQDLKGEVVRSEIRSPISGIVSELTVKPFDLVTKGQRICYVVPEDAEYQVEAVLPSSEVRRVHPGSLSRIKLPAYPAYEFGVLSGVVKSISPDASLFNTGEKGAPTFRLKIGFDEATPDLRKRAILLKPGLECRISIIAERRTLLQMLVTAVRNAPE